MADGLSSQGAPWSPAGGSHDSGGDQSPRSGVREQDRFLPIANISRIMKKALPASGKIAKDAKETGDNKGSANGADGSERKDGLQQPIPSSQGSFSQGMNYGNAQQQAQHMMVRMPGMD